MNPAAHLVHLLTVALPTQASELDAWAERTGPLLVGVNPGERLPPAEAWQTAVRPWLLGADLTQPLPVWAQVLGFAWAMDLGRQSASGCVERSLLHGWRRVSAHDWPADWPPALTLVLDQGWQALALRMVAQPCRGWVQPELNEAYRLARGVSTSDFQALKDAAPSIPEAAWQKAGRITDLKGLHDLAGQDLVVPVASEWPEAQWAEGQVNDWPQWSQALAEMRQACPQAQAQHDPAQRGLIVRALGLGRVDVARALGWDRWLESGRPLTHTLGPGQPERAVLDQFGRNGGLIRPQQLRLILEEVFQAALNAHRSDLWTGTDLPSDAVFPGLRFWTRAQGDAFAQRLTPETQGEGPAWWRTLIQAHPDLWAQGTWAHVGETAEARWLTWVKVACAKKANPLHALATVGVGSPAIRVMGGPFPWSRLTAKQEGAWAWAAIHQLAWERASFDDASARPEFRWAMATVARRWRQCPDRQYLWVPLIWAWLGALMDRPDDEEAPWRAAQARQWWNRLRVWGHRSPAEAQHVHQAQGHLWSVAGHPEVKALWRDLVARIAPLDARERRIRQRA